MRKFQCKFFSRLKCLSLSSFPASTVIPSATIVLYTRILSLELHTHSLSLLHTHNTHTHTHNTNRPQFITIVAMACNSDDILNFLLMFLFVSNKSFPSYKIEIGDSRHKGICSSRLSNRSTCPVCPRSDGSVQGRSQVFIGGGGKLGQYKFINQNFSAKF